MTKHRLFWGIYLAVMLTTVAAVLTASVFFAREVRELTLKEVRREVEVRAALLRRLVPLEVFSGRPELAQAVLGELGGAGGVRLTVVDADGRVLGDTEHDPATMENHATRPEIAAALAGRAGEAIRDSATLKVRSLYVAMPVLKDGRVAGVVRAAMTVPVIDRMTVALRRDIWVAALCILGAVAGVSYVVARRITRPVEQLKRAAEAYGNGDFTVRATTSRWDEIADLGSSLNAMAGRLKDRIETVIRQRNELEAVLSGMVEGVAALDEKGNLTRWNAAAARLFELDEAHSLNRHLYEVIHDPDIQAMVTQVMATGKVAEVEVEYGADQGRCLKVRGGPLTDAAGRQAGAVMVAEDYTRYRQLDRMRRDFVANASHELKTPIAAIKGAIETLQDWALQDEAQARRFTEMAARQVDRLENLAGDLLKLSSVEHGVETRSIVLAPVGLADVIRGAVDNCRVLADDRRIILHAACPEGLKVSASAPLLEQALVNLLDNAIKYSEPDRMVWIEGVEMVDGVEVSVRDQGCGIAAQDLDRIFERFYRVDKARSREVGGTGLGLSIVRHIALAHGGSVRVSSVPGEGSVFTLWLPRVSA